MTEVTNGDSNGARALGRVPVAIYIALINLIVLAVTGGVLWGALDAKVDDLRSDIERERGQQLNWNSDERRQDDIHRERMNQLQSQMFELLKDLKLRPCL